MRAGGGPAGEIAVLETAVDERARPGVFGYLAKRAAAGNGRSVIRSADVDCERRGHEVAKTVGHRKIELINYMVAELERIDTGIGAIQIVAIRKHQQITIRPGDRCSDVRGLAIH